MCLFEMGRLVDSIWFSMWECFVVAGLVWPSHPCCEQHARAEAGRDRRLKRYTLLSLVHQARIGRVIMGFSKVIDQKAHSIMILS
jgi:hypothetical protein